MVLDILGTLVGLLYLWLEYRASIKLWIVGLIMPTIYLFTYYKAGLYADFGIQIYYLIVTAYGWFHWRFNSNGQTADLPITHASRKFYPMALLAFSAAWIGIYFVLLRLTDSSVPFCDSFIAALSIIALWMLARKYLEQWLAWMAVDAVCCALYVYKDIPFTAALYGLYALFAVAGFRKWKRLMSDY